LRLCTGRTSYMGSTGIALLFLDHGTRRGEGSASRPGRSLPPGKTRHPLHRRRSGPPGPVWTGAENLAPTGIRSPVCPARSQSLYRLSYPAHYVSHTTTLIGVVFGLALPFFVVVVIVVVSVVMTQKLRKPLVEHKKFQNTQYVLKNSQPTQRSIR